MDRLAAKDIQGLNECIHQSAEGILGALERADAALQECIAGVRQGTGYLPQCAPARSPDER